MTNLTFPGYPRNTAVNYLSGLYTASPEQYPEDDELDQALQNNDWKKVVSRLSEIRDTESAHERLMHRRQMTSDIEPSCMAEKILNQAAAVYMQARAEQKLFASL